MKLMINIPDEAYELLKSKPELDNIAESIIANGIPVSNKVDLISRSELKKALKSNCDICNDKNTNWCEHCCPLNDFENLIDNAPTVEQKYYERVIAQINPVIEARPHGEWIDICTLPIIRKCSICGNEIGNEMGFYNNFCPKCGADMRGEVGNNGKAD